VKTCSRPAQSETISMGIIGGGALIAEEDYNRLMNPLFRSCSTAVLQVREIRDFYNLAQKQTKI
jgi:hypothetical protein